MKIYVASKWEEKEAAREFIYHIKSLGHEIVHDWTIQDDTKDEVELRNQAMDDIAGIKNSDIVILYLTKENKYLAASPNRYVEAGIAIGAGIPVYIVGKPRDDFLFRRHPLVQIFEKKEDLPL